MKHCAYFKLLLPLGISQLTHLMYYLLVEVNVNMMKWIAYCLPIICTIWTFFIWVSCAGTIIRYISTCRYFQPDFHFWFHLFSCYFSHCNTFVLVSFRFLTKCLCLLSNIKFHTTKCRQCTNRFIFLCIVKTVLDTFHQFWLISDGIDFGRRDSTDSGSSWQ